MTDSTRDSEFKYAGRAILLEDDPCCSESENQQKLKKFQRFIWVKTQKPANDQLGDVLFHPLPDNLKFLEEKGN